MTTAYWQEKVRQDQERLLARLREKLGREPDKSRVYFEFDGPALRNGNRPFTLYWWQEGFHLGPQWRGQCFLADPNEYLKNPKCIALG